MDLRFDAADVRTSTDSGELDKDGWNACESARGIKTANLSTASSLSFPCEWGTPLRSTLFVALSWIMDCKLSIQREMVSFLSCLCGFSLALLIIYPRLRILYWAVRTMLFRRASQNRASPYRREVACNKGLNS